MSLLDTASLIVTPNGYKEGTLYSVIPSDGSGDMSVVRATTATRVNSAGLVELVPYNLLSWSEDFSNADWTKSNVTISANSTTAPNGTLSADTLTASGGTALHTCFWPTAQFGANHTISVYAKKNTNNFLQIYTDFVNTDFANFDLNNGVVGSVGSTVISSSIESVGNGWYRCSFVTGASASRYVNFSIISSATSPRTESNALTTSVFIWGAQLVEGTLPKDYQKTETRLNIPRLDYSNGTCPSILVEPQRTNYLQYSEKLIDGFAFNYISGTFTVTENTTDTLDPFGNNNAEKFNVTTIANNDSYTAFSGSGNKTMSIFAKKGTSNDLTLQLFNVNSGIGCSASFNLNTGVVSGTGGSIVASSIKSYGNGWYRCSLTGADTNVFGNINSVILNAGTVYLFGLQGEAGSYPTSYIPTTSASVTRNADVVSKTGISSLIGQTEGTLFCDSYINISNNQLSGLLGITNTVENFIYLFYIGNQVYQQTNIGGALNTTYIATIPSSGRYKIALAYKSNDFSFYINGTQVWQTTTASVPACSDVSFQNATLGINSGSNINANILWKTRLTNTQLAQLTTI